MAQADNPNNPLTRAEINRLLQRERNKGKTFYFARDANGVLTRVAGKAPTGGIGKFEGRLGTPVRSRKGRTYRKGNGYTRYVPGEPEVVMY